MHKLGNDHIAIQKAAPTQDVILVGCNYCHVSILCSCYLYYYYSTMCRRTMCKSENKDEP